MGADLYINSLYEPQRERWALEFEAAVKHRDSLPANSPNYDDAQKRVHHCFEQMRKEGYFRDPYNKWDLLQQLDLSWGSDVIPMLDKDDRLNVTGAKKLLVMLAQQEDVFDKRLSALSESDRQYFRDRYVELRDFLNQAVALGEAIDCSL